MSLRVALTGIGTIVGAAFGNPQLGYMLGSVVGNLVDPQTIKGPSIGEIANQTAQEGVSRPIVFGTSPPFAGNIMGQSEPVITRNSSGGKGGPKTVTESVSRTYHIRVCEGPVLGFRRIWRNNVLVYDASPNPLLTDEENVAFLEKARLFLGDFTQLPSPDLEALYGAGLVPAYRGTAYMVMVDEDLTDLQGAIPQWMFQVGAASTIEAVREVITNAAEGAFWTPPDGVDEVDVLVVGPGGWGGTTFGDVRYSAAGGGGGGEVNWQEGLAVSGPVAIRVDSAVSADRDATYFGSIVSLRGSHGGFGVASTPEGQGGGGSSSTTGSVTSVDPPIWGYSKFGPGSGLYDGQPATLTTHTVWLYGYNGSIGGGGGGAGGNAPSNLNAQPNGAPGVYMGDKVGDDLGDGGWFGAGGGGTVGTFVTTNPVGASSISNGVGGIGGGGDGANSAGADASNAVPFTGSGGGAQQVGNFIWPFDVGEGAQGVVVIQYYLSEGDPEGPISVPDVVEAIAERANLPVSLLDLTDLEGLEIYGILITNQYPAIEAIRSIGQMKGFDLSPRDGKVVAVRRGGNSVATLTEDDLVDDDSELEEDKRNDAISIPRLLNLNYHDIAGGLATDKQTSERSGDRRANSDLSIQSPIVMSAPEAAQAAVVNHKVMAENQRGQVRFSLGDEWIKLCTADPVILPVGAVNRRVRIEKLEIMDGYQNYECAYDRQSAYTSNAEGIPAAPQSTPPTSLVGPTILVPLDIPMLQDSDDSVGLSYRVAVSGVSPAWPGALVELSLDGGATYAQSQTATASAIIGELLSALPDHPAEFPDEVHSFTVRIDTPLGELESTDLAGMMNRLNLCAIGNAATSPSDRMELINFAAVSETSAEGDWTITGPLLRGRKDSGTRAHAIGEKFVLLDIPLLGFVPANLTDLGRTLTFRATTLGAPVDTGTIVSIVYEGRSQIERHAGYLSARRDGTDMIVTFQGVGRLGGGATVAQGIRFSGYRVRFDDGTNPVIVVNTLSQEVTQDISTLSGPVTISVTQVNDLTGEGPAIEVVA